MIVLWEAEDDDNLRLLYAAIVKLVTAGPRH
jgi:hypothetical protein